MAVGGAPYGELALGQNSEAFAYVSAGDCALGEFGLGQGSPIVVTGLLPGSGKRRNFPRYIAQPPYEAKPNKPFRPVWDKPPDGAIEAHPIPAPGPAPLPPAALFGRPGQAGDASTNAPDLALPDFNDFTMHDPMGLGRRLRDLQDQGDAMAVLQALGLLQQG